MDASENKPYQVVNIGGTDCTTVKLAAAYIGASIRHIHNRINQRANRMECKELDGRLYPTVDAVEAEKIRFEAARSKAVAA